MSKTRSLDELHGELAKAMGARREYQRAHRGPFREDLAGRAELAIAAARARLAALAAQELTFGSPPLGSPQSLALAEAAARCSPAAEQAFEAAAKSLEEVVTESRADVDRVVAKYDQAIAELEAERKAAEKALALAQLEEQFA